MSSSCIFAQPIINKTHIPSYGIIVKEVRDTNGGVPLFVTGPGPSQVWDYSNAFVAPVDTGEMVISHPDSTPYSSYFPGATYAVDLLEVGNTWGYFRVDSTGVYWLGNYHYGPIVYAGVTYPTDTPSFISPREMFMPFPFSYGTVIKDTSRAALTLRKDTVIIIPTSIYLTRITHKYKTFTGDGYGKLITPNRIFSDVVRLKTTVHQIDTTLINGTFYSVDDYSYNIYQWLVPVRLEFPMVMQVWMTDTTDALADNAYYRIPAGCDAYGMGMDTCVWAGDANADQQANHYDLLNLGLFYNDSLPERDFISDDYLGSPSDPTGDTLNNGYDKYHVDCNGDGIIDSTDINSILQNFGDGHNKTISVSEPNPANPDLYFEVLTPNVAPGTEVEVKVMAGRDTVGLYGLAFEAQLDTALIKSGSLSVQWDSSWLGKLGTNMIVVDNIKESSGLVSGGCVRIDKNEKKNFGEIARLKFKVSDSFNASTVYQMSICSQGGVKSTGEAQPFNCSTDTFATGIKKTLTYESNIEIYPNPSNGIFTIILPESNSEYKITLFNSLGQQVLNEQYSGRVEVPLNAARLPNGVYVVQIQSDDVQFKKNLVITK